ncbi:hypothetical protein TNCV_2376481 [Trichonephila clavipes]|nr:hypothetical protein TNCV_2376481 [Trichonephila clavipes]
MVHQPTDRITCEITSMNIYTLTMDWTTRGLQQAISDGACNFDSWSSDEDYTSELKTLPLQTSTPHQREDFDSRQI